ncbi:hypothetical protein JY97_04460 [Alkalispirochaeta odontotermitis]|nr:hypothetical protein JY97_04460 [Alkalispirochaeta odontotermitis]
MRAAFVCRGTIGHICGNRYKRSLRRLHRRGEARRAIRETNGQIQSHDDVMAQNRLGGALHPVDISAVGR